VCERERERERERVIEGSKQTRKKERESECCFTQTVKGGEASLLKEFPPPHPTPTFPMPSLSLSFTSKVPWCFSMELPLKETQAHHTVSNVARVCASSGEDLAVDMCVFISNLSAM